MTGPPSRGIWKRQKRSRSAAAREPPRAARGVDGHLSVLRERSPGGRRLLQKAHGYEATIVSGKVTYRGGVATGALPGQVVRGQRAA